MEALNQKLDELNTEAQQFGILKSLQEKSGVKAVFFILGGVGLALVLVLTGYFAQFLANATGFVYPVYKSIKSLESPQLDDDKQWLTYWTVYGLFVIFDDWSHFITGYLPQYFLIKMIFLIWLFAPTTKGAVLLYNTIIKDLFSKYSKKLDKLFTQVIGESKQLADELKSQATDTNNLGKLINAAGKLEEVVKNQTEEVTPKAD